MQECRRAFIEKRKEQRRRGGVPSSGDVGPPVRGMPIYTNEIWEEDIKTHLCEMPNTLVGHADELFWSIPYKG